MIKTHRIEIKPLGLAEVLDYIEQRKGFVNDDDKAAELADVMIPELSRADGDDALFYTIWVGMSNDRQVIDMGCHRTPDEYGLVEIWYNAQEEGAGYATEAVDGFLKWLKEKKVVFASASVEKWNIKSKRVLAKNGFRRIGVKGGMDIYCRQLIF